MLKKRVFLFDTAIITLFIIVLLTACNEGQPETNLSPDKDLINRGKVLVTAGGCNDCHTPKIFGPQGPKLDGSRILSGHPAEMKLAKFDPSILEPGKYVLFTQDITAAVGPWGASFSANLTPDNETGIGTWQPDMFINAMRTGKHLGAGRPIQPPMPWEGLAQLSDEDLRAIFVYLKSVPAVKNKVPEPISLEQLLNTK